MIVIKLYSKWGAGETCCIKLIWQLQVVILFIFIIEVVFESVIECSVITQRWWRTEQVAQGGCGCPIPADIQGQAGCGSGQPGLLVGDPAHSRGLELDEHCAPFQPRLFYGSVSRCEGASSPSAFWERSAGGAYKVFKGKCDAKNYLLLVMLSCPPI